MGLFGGRAGSNQGTAGKGQTTSLNKTAYVNDIILDDTHDLLKKVTDKSAQIGTIRFRYGADNVMNSAELPSAFPLDKQFKSFPVKNELVEIHEITANTYGYRRFGTEINPSRTSSNTAIKSIAKPQPNESQKLNDYRENSETKTAKSSEDEKVETGPGKYYKSEDNIHKLKLYEGDTLVESRFGQSIRFSAFNNDKKQFSPTLTIRNGESALNRKLDENVSVEEDINRDGSVILFGSGLYEMPFQPGLVDDGGKSNFTTKPESFLEYPSKLVGDQILINSGRLIFSAKDSEMMFFSKKNYGFVSDGGLSIDNKLGINVSVGDDINVVTNNRDVRIYSGNGSIFLGDKAPLEPLVKGTQLVNILHELIVAITNQVFLTPSGPTDIGPTNISEFQTISNKLNDILSKLNQTA